MKISLKEIIWFCVPIIVSFLLIAGSGEGFSVDTTVDINIHDTYFVIAPLHLVLLLIPVLGFFIFVIRSALYRFKNRQSNISLAIYALMFVLEVVFLTYSFSHIKSL